MSTAKIKQPARLPLFILKVFSNYLELEPSTQLSANLTLKCDMGTYIISKTTQEIP